MMHRHSSTSSPPPPPCANNPPRFVISSSISSSSKNSTKWRVSKLIPFFMIFCITFNASLYYLWSIQNNAIHATAASATASTAALSTVSTPKESPVLGSSPPPPVVIAHVVSLIKCSKEAAVTGFLDAAAVLRHSIHKTSIHNTDDTQTNSRQSKYSYKMYAIVHSDCAHHAHVLDRLGYTSIVQDSPVPRDEIEEGWYKNHVEGENCCGSKEFIKLYAYTLTDHPVTVHWDLDVAIFQPMDDLYDSMLYPASSEEGMAARTRLQVQHPHRPLPPVIDAFFTRDITSAQPWESKQGVQGGFLVSRPNLQQFEMYKEFIRRGNYTAGRGDGTGWDALGYGGFQGAMAYQGVVAYFYDVLAPNTAVELDICIWNQVVADVIWRGPGRKREHYLQCREYPTRPGDTFKDNTPQNGRCKDCRITPVEDVITAHYTACKKPWECSIPTPRVPRDKSKIEKLQELTNVTTCGKLHHKWFELRLDFERALERHGGIVPAERQGSYRPDFFYGYCKGPGGYIAMNPPPPDFDITKVYGV